MPSLLALADSIDALLAPAPAGTEIVMPRSTSVARLGLALDASPATIGWATKAVDALFVHRRWTRNGPPWPTTLGGLANHDAFDRRFGLATAPELVDALGLCTPHALATRDDHPLAVVSDVAPTDVAGVRQALTTLFGGIEAELPAPNAERTVRRVVVARAMTAALVEEAARAGADVYVTGQRRAPAAAAVAATGLQVLAVGHRRSERWGLHQLGMLIGARWPDLVVSLAPDDR